VAGKVKRTNVRAECLHLHQFKGHLLALGLFKNTEKLPEVYARVDQSTGGTLRDLLASGDFTGNCNETMVLYASKQAPCRRLMLVGLGDKDKFTRHTLRQSAGTAVRAAEKLGAAKIGLALHCVVNADLPAESIGQAVAEGAVVGRYDYQDYLSEKAKNNKTVPAMQIILLEPKAANADALKKGCRLGSILADAQNLARSIANKPGNEINPPALARWAQRLARHSGFRCRIFNDRQLKAMNMNAILAVGSGSASKPRLIRLDYTGRRTARSKPPGPDAVLVGKAVTFDSGGLNVKPAQHMEHMKFDKCGGCAVLGIFQAAARLKLPVNLVGLIPSAENMPSNTSYRPDDVIRTYNGKTVEIVNTDAEGRMILCDALAYAAKLKPNVIIDLATLTGACVIALGEHHAGLFGNNEDLIEKLKRASAASGEPLWPMPCGDEYLEQMKGKIADLKNHGGREGGSCTAAAFLGQFVNNTPWAHIDIAGTADTDKEKPYRALGATGFGVRLLVEYLRTLSSSPTGAPRC